MIWADLQDKFPSLEAEKIREFIRANFANSMKIIGALLKKLISGGFALMNLLSLLLITPIVAFYMLRDWHTFLKNVISICNYKKSTCSIVRGLSYLW